MISISLEPFLDAEEFSNVEPAIIGIYAVESSTGRVLIEKNSHFSFMPASCMKIVSTAAALYILGPDTRFETHLEYDGVLSSNEILQGNLYIRGGGDPCLGSERVAGSLPWKEQVRVWADAVEKLGIRKIEGRVIGDASRWEKALAVPSWSWEDLGNYYGAGASALSFHENSYSLFLKPNEKLGEDAAILRTDPPQPMSAFKNELKTGPEGSGDCACIYGSEFSPLQFIRGTIPIAVSEFAIRGAIPDPAAYSADLLYQELRARGIQIEAKEIASNSTRISFHVTYSPTIDEIVHWANQKSINLYAEHLLKKMGEVVFGKGSTEAGIKAVTEFWGSQGIDLNGFNMVDGSGLSRKNLITNAQLVKILSKIKTSPFFPTFLESLPQLETSVRAKSGSMSLARGFAGYAGDIVFSIIVNQCIDSKKMREKTDEFLKMIDKTVSTK